VAYGDTGPSGPIERLRSVVKHREAAR